MEKSLNNFYELIHKTVPYLNSDYGKTLTEAIIHYKPTRILEFGSGVGFTTLHLALGCYVNGFGNVYTHDIFETQSTGIFRQFSQREFLNNIKKIPELANHIQSNILDYNVWLESSDFNFDFIYIDVNNDGDKILKIYEKLHVLENKGKILLFEGGHPERGSRKYKNVTQIHNPRVQEITKHELIYHKEPGIIKIIL